MLTIIRKFSNTKWAAILLGILIIPFVFWGMGGSFNVGNKNTIVQINNEKVSTKEFMDYLNSLNLNADLIRKNINNSILEQLLTEFIGNRLLLLEIKDLKLELSDDSLAKIIKNNKQFLDEDGKFSRTKYEKYLISKNFTAQMFENQIRQNQKKKLLFNYISGGTYPPVFSVKKFFNDQNQKIHLQMVNIENLYKIEVKEEDIDKFINDNKEFLKEKFVKFRYAEIKPESISSTDVLDENFYKKIEEIENSIINGENYESIVNKYKLNTENINFVRENEYKKDFAKELFKKNIGTVELVEKENKFIIFVVDEIKNDLPKLDSKEFKEKIKNQIIDSNKIKINNDLLKKIFLKEYKYEDFLKLAKDQNINIEKITINGIRDNKILSLESNKQIFYQSKNKFFIDKKKDSPDNYLFFVNKIEENNIKKDSKEYNKYFNETTIALKNNIYSSFDYYLNQKYKIKINHQTLERLKNYFQ